MQNILIKIQIEWIDFDKKNIKQFKHFYASNNSNKFQINTKNCENNF